MSGFGTSFLVKAASCLSKNSCNKTLTVLKSYYLMRCKNISNGYGLPQKQFSSSSRCPHCCIEWSSTTETKVLPLKLTKRQKRRNRLREKKSTRNMYSNKILKGNRLVKTCNFCSHSTTCSIMPQKSEITLENNVIETNELMKKQMKKPPVNTQTVAPVNVYCNSKQAFSLMNKNNTLKSTIKIEKKVIRNNKKQKDKFAGLCQKAVLSANKIKEEKEKENKINLFLKPT